MSRKTSARSNTSSTAKIEPKPTLDFLVRETEKEHPDRRRIFMLKSQLMALERQLLVMADSVGHRRELHMFISEALGDLANFCCSAIGQPSRSPDVTVKRAQLMEIVEKARRLQSTLGKSVDCTLEDRHPDSLLAPNKFRAAPSQADQPRSLLTSTRSLSTLNLVQVSHLEDNLGKLYGELTALRELSRGLFAESLVPTRLRTEHEGLIDDVNRMLETCCDDLLELSLLIPVYPPVVKRAQGLKSHLPNTCEEMVRHLTEVKSERARSSLESGLKNLEHEAHLLREENAALRGQLNLHQRLLADQASYADAIVSGLRQGCRQFRESVRTEISDSLVALITSYSTMERHSTGEALKDFLGVCRLQMPVLQSAVDSLEQQLGRDEGEDKLFKELKRVLLTSVKQGNVTGMGDVVGRTCSD